MKHSFGLWIFTFTVVCLVPVAPVAQARDSANTSSLLKILNEDYRSSMHDLKLQEKMIRRKIKESRQYLADLHTASSIDGRPDLDGACDCRPLEGSGCTEEFWVNRMGRPKTALPDLAKQPTQGCLDIYNRFATQPAVIPASCKALVMGVTGTRSIGCGVVRRLIEDKLITRELAKLERALLEIPQQRKELKAEFQDELESLQPRSVSSQRKKDIPDDVKSGRVEKTGSAGSAQ